MSPLTTVSSIGGCRLGHANMRKVWELGVEGILGKVWGGGDIQVGGLHRLPAREESAVSDSTVVFTGRGNPWQGVGGFTGACEYSLHAGIYPFLNSTTINLGTSPPSLFGPRLRQPQLYATTPLQLRISSAERPRFCRATRVENLCR